MFIYHIVIGQMQILHGFTGINSYFATHPLTTYINKDKAWSGKIIS